MIHTVKGFGIVNKAEIDVFLELSCFFHDPVDVGNLISGSSAFSKTRMWSDRMWSTGEGNGKPLQYSCLENPMNSVNSILTLKVKVKSLSCVRLFATTWTVAYQAFLSMGFSRQEYWSGLLFPSPGDLPDPGIEPGSPALEADALTSEPPGNLF